LPTLISYLVLLIMPFHEVVVIVRLRWLSFFPHSKQDKPLSFVIPFMVRKAVSPLFSRTVRSGTEDKYPCLIFFYKLLAHLLGLKIFSFYFDHLLFQVNINFSFLLKKMLLFLCSRLIQMWCFWFGALIMPKRCKFVKCHGQPLL
jgi:hypothetical protein